MSQNESRNPEQDELKRFQVNVSFAIMEDTPDSESICHFSSCRSFQALGEENMELKLKDTFKHHILPKSAKAIMSSHESNRDSSPVLVKRRASCPAAKGDKVRRLSPSKENCLTIGEETGLSISSNVSNNSCVDESNESAPLSPSNSPTDSLQMSVEIPLVPLQILSVDPRHSQSLPSVKDVSEDRHFPPQKVTLKSANVSGSGDYVCQEVSIVDNNIEYCELDKLGQVERDVDKTVEMVISEKNSHKETLANDVGATHLEEVLIVENGSSSCGIETFDQGSEASNEFSLSQSTSVKEFLNKLLEDACSAEDFLSSSGVETSTQIEDVSPHNNVEGSNEIPTNVDDSEATSQYDIIELSSGVSTCESGNETPRPEHKTIESSLSDLNAHIPIENVDVDVDSVGDAATKNSITVLEEKENLSSSKNDGTSTLTAELIHKSPTPDEDLKVIDCSLSIGSNDVDPSDWLEHICSPKNRKRLSHVIERKVTRSTRRQTSKREDVIDSYLDTTIVPSSETALFNNCYFLVTGGERHMWSKTLKKRLPLLATPFEKEKIKQLIREHGGNEIETINQELLVKQKDEKIKIFLVASKCTETFKFLQAVACGFVPCLHHTWLLNSIENNSLEPVEPYMLPRGWSSRRCGFVYLEHSTPGLFCGLKIAILRFAESPVSLSLSKCCVIEDESNLKTLESSSESSKWPREFKHILELAQAEVVTVRLLPETQSDVGEVTSFVLALQVDYIVVCEHSLPNDSTFLASLKQQCPKIVSKYVLLDMLIEGIPHP